MKTRLLILFSGFILSLQSQVINVEISNPIALKRNNETVEISWNTIKKQLHLRKSDQVIVVDAKGVEYPSQMIFEGNATPQKLIFQVSLGAKQTQAVMIKKGIPQTYETKTFGRFVPERKDDYAWENDRVAFRIYGPALIKTDGPSNGFDVWCKRTEKMIINTRYEKELSGRGSYHTDWGDGLDMYKVGRTLGAGAMAPYLHDTLALASNFTTQETLDNGPIRTTFRVKYAPFRVDDNLVSETRTISIDAGSQLCSVKEEYSGMKNRFSVAAGIVKRAGVDSIYIDKANTYAIYKEPNSDKNGAISLALVMPTGWKSTKQTDQHLLAIADYNPANELTYYTGYGWSKWGFPTLNSWIDYINNFVKIKKYSLIIRVK